MDLYFKSRPEFFNRSLLRKRNLSRNVKLLSTVKTMAFKSAKVWIEENLQNGSVIRESSLGGSSWSSAYLYETNNGSKYFVKTSRNSDEKMFKGEALGLQALFDTQTLRIPKVFHVGPTPQGCYIIMEHLNMGSLRNQADLGTLLAKMHLATPQDPTAANGKFGFPVDNTIGGTPQPNGWMDDWVEFYRTRRLKHQLNLAGDSRLSKLGEILLPQLEHFFEGIEVRPSVLHGDLWSGNIASVDSQPCIFDPATYYGHHEAEFGMSWCAGFSQSFYDAYHDIIPRAPGFQDRRELYMLYHYLNHYNLFGSGYYNTCERIMEQLVSKLK